MPAFRRVIDAQAGPTALGILVPPGPRTLVILRPRGLAWDLLPARPAAETGSLTFCDFSREEAAGLARKVQSALEDQAVGSSQPLEVMTAASGFVVRVKLAAFLWIVCSRIPGKPYQPLIFPIRADAQEAVAQLAPVLCPPADADQEYYFNTQNFSR
jgi:hypothetical protein